MLCTLLLAMLVMAPRQAVEVCTGDCCRATPVADHDACSCCCEHAAHRTVANGSPHEGDAAPLRVRRSCGPGCRMALVYDVDLQLVDSPTPIAATAAHLPTPGPGTFSPGEATVVCAQPPDRGPPRTDRATSLRRSTVLLI